MGWLRRLTDRLDPPPVETRSKLSTWEILSQLAPTTGAYSARLAENLSTVLAAVNAISTAIASLPAEIQRRRPDGGWESDERAPEAALIQDGPNPHQSWPDWLEWTVASVLLTGNALSETRRDGSGAVRELVPIPWSGVAVSRALSGRLVYEVTDVLDIPGRTAPTRRLLESELLHLKDRSDDGLIGRSRLQRAAGVLRPALALQEFTGSMWQNGSFPSGALELEHKLPYEQRQELRSNFEQIHAGPTNAARVLILDQGLKWKSISVSPEDAEVLASRRFTVEELARIYGVPPPVVGDLSHGTFTNSETMLRWFAMGTLTPWIAKIEGEFHRSIFPAAVRATSRLQIDLSGLLRGDPETRWASHKIAVEANILTRNEVREVEGWAPRPELDRAPSVSVA
jgi:HK97 family phage portal protein